MSVQTPQEGVHVELPAYLLSLDVLGHHAECGNLTQVPFGVDGDLLQLFGQLCAGRTALFPRTPQCMAESFVKFFFSQQYHFNSSWRRERNCLPERWLQPRHELPIDSCST